MSISIKVENNYNAFNPGDEINGQVSWSLKKNPKKVTVNLMWRTEGKGTQDIEVVDSREFETYQTVGEQDFCFTLPIGPYSCSGRLVSICWALEAFVKSGNAEDQYELIIAPNGEEIHL